MNGVRSFDRVNSYINEDLTAHILQIHSNRSQPPLQKNLSKVNGFLSVASSLDPATCTDVNSVN